jgi:F420-dependent oxidoreductase-like protein
MALAGRATTSIELGTSVLQTYTSHPVLQANRAISVAEAIGRPGFTLGLGPSHQLPIEAAYGLSYDHPGRHTEEYVSVVMRILAGDSVSFDGDEYRVHLPGRGRPLDPPVTVLLAALAPRLLRVAGQIADGTILWMGNARAVATHVAPRIGKAAADAGRPAPRIVAGLPVAVCDDVDEGRQAAASMFANYGTLPNYRRLLDLGEADGPADAAIVGDEQSVTAQLQGLLDAGATDLWAAVFPVGADRAGSRARTRALLQSLL